MLDLLKEMKKVDEDSKSVTMAHPKGHTMMILYKGLKPIEKEALKRLPLYEGGGVHKSAMEVDRPKNKTEKSWAGESKAGELVRNSDIKPSSKEKAKEEHHKVLGEMKSQPNPKLKGLAHGGEIHAQECQCPKCFDAGGGVDSNNSDNSDSSKPTAPVVVNVGQPAGQATQQVAPPNGIQQEAQKTLGGVGLEQQAIKQQQAIDAQKAAASVPALQENINTNQGIIDRLQQSRNTVDTAAQRLKAYQDANPEDQNQYVKNMPGGQKALTAIGLVLGGFGQGYSGAASNPAMDYLENKIKQNIDQQRHNWERERNVYGAFHEAFNDDVVATNLATANAKERMANQIDLAAKKLGTAQAQQAATQASGKLLADSNELRINAAGALANKYGQMGRGSQQPAQGQPIQQISNPQNSGQQNESPVNKILKPGASDQVSQMIKYDPSIPESDKAKISSQLTQAEQSEKSLAAVDSAFENLVKNSREGGWSGRIHRTISPHAVAAIGTGVGATVGSLIPGVGTAAGAGAGGALGEGLGQGASAVTNTDINRRFESDKSRLAGMLSSAVPRGSEFIGKLLEDNTPEYNDDTPTLKRKLGAIKEFIMNHTETDALKRHGLSYK